MIARLVVRTVLFSAWLALLLFGAARTFVWPEAWVFLALFAGLGLGVGLGLAQRDPELLEERMRPPVRRTQRPWDRALMTLAGVAFFAWLAAMGFEVGRRGVRTPAAAQVLGAVLVAGCFVGAAWIFRENRFAIPVVAVQGARGQRVITTGPYAVVRHPMYAGVLLFFLGTPLLLGSRWGLLFVPLMLPLLVVRAVAEERVLRAELPGYAEYAARVRARFFPGVW